MPGTERSHDTANPKEHPAVTGNQTTLDTGGRLLDGRPWDQMPACRVPPRMGPGGQ